MKRTETIMGIPITIEVIDEGDDIDRIFEYFRAVDRRFSTYKPDSEVSRLNRGEITRYSDEMNEVLRLCEETKQLTDGYFDIRRNGVIDPSGLVKGWSIRNAGVLLKQQGCSAFYIDAGGDIEAVGKAWTVGIRNPFDEKTIVKKLSVKDRGVATSGTYNRGQHIYNPRNPAPLTDIVSLTVIGPDVYEADRFATAAFAMGRQGIGFIERMPGFEAFMIDSNGIATLTSSFHRYVV